MADHRDADTDTEGAECAERPEGDAEAEHVLGAADRDEPELARVGRVALANQIDRHTAALHHRARGIINRAYDGDTVTLDDVEALRSELEQLEWWLDEYVEPVARDEEGRD